MIYTPPQGRVGKNKKRGKNSEGIRGLQKKIVGYGKSAPKSGSWIGSCNYPGGMILFRIPKVILSVGLDEIKCSDINVRLAQG